MSLLIAPLILSIFFQLYFKLRGIFSSALLHLIMNIFDEELSGLIDVLQRTC